MPNWFVRVTDIKGKLMANNEKTHWVPSYVKEKRFHNWLEVLLSLPLATLSSRQAQKCMLRGC